jgi:hypothetical protein
VPKVLTVVTVQTVQTVQTVLKAPIVLVLVLVLVLLVVAMAVPHVLMVPPHLQRARCLPRAPGRARGVSRRQRARRACGRTA